MDVVDLTEPLEPASAISSSCSSSSTVRNRHINDNDDDDVVEIVYPTAGARIIPPVKVSKKRQKRSWQSNTTANTIICLDDDDGDEIIVFDARKQQQPQHLQLAPNTSTAAATTSTTPIIPTITTPMDRILELFPDIKRSHVCTLLGRFGMLDAEMNAPITSEHFFNLKEGQISTAIQNLVENGMTYPKEELTPPPNPPVGSSSSSNSSSAATLKSRVYSYDYSASSVEYDRSPVYNDQCLQYLLYEVFPFLTRAGLKLHLHHCKGRYHLCHTMLCNILMGQQPSLTNNNTNAKDTTTTTTICKEEQEEINLQQLKRVLRRKRPSDLTPTQIASFATPHTSHTSTSIILRYSRIKKINPLPVTDPILREEIAYTTGKFDESSAPIEQRQKMRTARRISERDGTTIECQCCYGDCAWEEMVSCREEGHLFCVECLRRHAEERVFGFGDLGKGGGGRVGVVELICMAGGCESAFAYDQLTKALPPKIMKKYDEVQASLVVEKAGMQHLLCKCPQCEFQAMLPETEMIFHCPDCQFASCRKCEEPPHIPLRCEEVEKKDETNARLKIEEAMTKARVRSCPKCAKKFYKTEGCNKMCCPTCKTYICYVCREQIDPKVGYKHFCQTPHCTHGSCKKCPLYSKSEEDDLRAAREAGIKTAEMLKVQYSKDGVAVGNENGDGSKSIKLDLEKILENPT